MLCSRKCFAMLCMVFGSIIFIYYCKNLQVLSTKYFHKVTATADASPDKYRYRNLTFDKDKGDVFSFVHIQKTGGTSMEKHLVFNIENSNCKCEKTKKPSCMCYRKDMSEIWLVCRYIQPKWPCGLHPDYETLKECVPHFIESNYDHRDRRYFYGTIIRNPMHRFLSELRHMQRGASWESAASLCGGKQLMNQIPSCYSGKVWNDLTIKEFVECPHNLAINRQTWMLSNISEVGCDFQAVMSDEKRKEILLNIAKHNLDSIDYFGILEYPHESQYIFEKTFNLKFKEPFRKWDTGFAIEYLKSFKQTDEMINKILKLNSLDVSLYTYAKKVFFERFNYFVQEYGPSTYKEPSATGKFALGDIRRERLKHNLPKSEVKEMRLQKKREKEKEKEILEAQRRHENGSKS